MASSAVFAFHITRTPFDSNQKKSVSRVGRLRDLMGFVTRNGFEHHVAMVRGNHAAVVDEAVNRYLGWPIYHHRGAPQYTAVSELSFRP